MTLKFKPIVDVKTPTEFIERLNSVIIMLNCNSELRSIGDLRRNTKRLLQIAMNELFEEFSEYELSKGSNFNRGSIGNNQGFYINFELDDQIIRPFCLFYTIGVYGGVTLFFSNCEGKTISNRFGYIS